MKKLLVLHLIIILTLSGFAQKNSFFTIKGHITGFPDGTKVSFYDRNTDAIDSMTVIRNDSFFITGREMKQPDFIYLVFAEKPPAIPLLLRNDQITVSGSKESLENLSVSGSVFHADYERLEKLLSPYTKNKDYTPGDRKAISDICTEFVKENTSSFASLLAISENLQVNKDPDDARQLMKKLSAYAKRYEFAKTLSKQISWMTSSGIGKKIQDFSQKDMNGKVVKISDFRGQYVLIDFWASWCGPCRMENPNVVENFNRFKNKNFTVLGVSLDESKSAWISAIQKDNLAWTQVSDLKGWQNKVSRLFEIKSIPQNILIDPDGIIIARNLRGGTLRATLEKLFN